MKKIVGILLIMPLSLLKPSNEKIEETNPWIELISARAKSNQEVVRQNKTSYTASLLQEMEDYVELLQQQLNSGDRVDGIDEKIFAPGYYITIERVSITRDNKTRTTSDEVYPSQERLLIVTLHYLSESQQPLKQIYILRGQTPIE